MDNTDLSPLPEGANGPQFCATVRAHLAVLDDLPPERVQALHQHINTCEGCAAEFRLLNQVTKLFTTFADQTETVPSAHVDQAVMAAIAARSRKPVPITAQRRISRKSRHPLWKIGQVAIAAVFLLAALTTFYFHNTAQTFAIPASVSWSGYVLYHSETLLGAHNVQYHIESYHDLSTNRLHVETTIAGRLDVVAVSDGHAMLGIDMMHNVAQWDAYAWSVDDSLFNLAALRSDLQANHAIYLGKEHFQGQNVYRIRTRNGLILLLDMQYIPVNVLRSGTGEPMYDTLMWLPPSQVSSSMWVMNMPQGFQIGTLPERP